MKTIAVSVLAFSFLSSSAYAAKDPCQISAQMFLDVFNIIDETVTETEKALTLVEDEKFKDTLACTAGASVASLLEVFYHQNETRQRLLPETCQLGELMGTGFGDDFDWWDNRVWNMEANVIRFCDGSRDKYTAYVSYKSLMKDLKKIQRISKKLVTEIKKIKF